MLNTMDIFESETGEALWLSHRTYLYQLMHVVFGAKPTAEAVQAACAPLTVEAFEDAAHVGRALEETSVQHEAGRGSDGSRLSSLDRMCAYLRETAQGDCAQSESFVDELGCDYDALYRIPGKRFVRPWESPYVGPDETLFQQSTLDVRAWYHREGYELEAEQHFPDDHIAALMDFMARMSKRAYDAYADADDDEAARIVAMQSDFLGQHVLTWVDEFAEKTAEHDSRGYYAAFARGMADFAAVDCEVARVLAEGAR